MNWTSLLNDGRIRPTERHKVHDSRNDFESDFGRVVFSPAVRRMHDKTQVMPLSTDDNIHTRLTHSLEVMAVGQSLALELFSRKEFQTRSEISELDLTRKVLPIVNSACLMHDIGNPPFGHFGEESIRSFFEEFFSRSNELNLDDEQKLDFTSFDGNAQGFRIITKLQILDDLYGLNLSYATLASYLKYPNAGAIDKGRLSHKKRGVFQSERNYLDDIAEACGLKLEDGRVIRHPLSFLVEAADSICYRVMDIEDGFNKGWYALSDISDFFTQQGYKDLARELQDIDKNTESDAKKIVSFRLRLMSRFSGIAIDNFLQNYQSICHGDYNRELIQDDPDEVEAVLQKFIREKVFSKRDVLSLELAGDSVINGLLRKYTEYLFNSSKSYSRKAEQMISKSIVKAAKKETDCVGKDLSELPDYYKLRVIVDFVSGMTDQFALSHFQKLYGQKIT